ncbi:hypothetical protein LTS18_004895 [Coniosporium uncinatum]|uniref:Uncharacterized protein n=1 Tax=Coniosporium uncinatum TaxID=93489 RepID=A0ACC3DS19_9PEZI|nr:hypothetical protein LTS18_004895 [Coniosporium uncinatum]
MSTTHMSVEPSPFEPLTPSTSPSRQTSTSQRLGNPTPSHRPTQPAHNIKSATNTMPLLARCSVRQDSEPIVFRNSPKMGHTIPLRDTNNRYSTPAQANPQQQQHHHHNHRNLFEAGAQLDSFSHLQARLLAASLEHDETMAEMHRALYESESSGNDANDADEEMTDSSSSDSADDEDDDMDLYTDDDEDVDDTQFEALRKLDGRMDGLMNAFAGIRKEMEGMLADVKGVAVSYDRCQSNVHAQRRRDAAAASAAAAGWAKTTHAAEPVAKFGLPLADRRSDGRREAGVRKMEGRFEPIEQWVRESVREGQRFETMAQRFGSGALTPPAEVEVDVEKMKASMREIQMYGRRLAELDRRVYTAEKGWSALQAV